MRQTINLDNLTFEKVQNTLNEQLFLVNSTEARERPWLTNELLLFISDQSYAIQFLDRNEMRRAYDLAYAFYQAVWELNFDIDNGEIKLEQLMEFMQQDRYCINALNGERVCTVKEVEEASIVKNGDNVIEIVNKPVAELNEKDKVLMCYIAWAITGRWRYFKRAGEQISFTKEGKPEKTPASYILSVEHYFMTNGGICDILSGAEGTLVNVNGQMINRVYAAINKMKYIKKLGKYKYPESARDEVIPHESLAFVVNQVNNKMPKERNATLNKALSLILNNKQLLLEKFSTADRIILRKAFIELNERGVSFSGANNVSESDELHSICDEIREGVMNDLLSPDSFALNIVATITKYGYKKCSEKQMNILQEALDNIKKASEAKGIAEDIQSKTGLSADDTMSIDSLYNMIGSGDFNNEYSI